MAKHEVSIPPEIYEMSLWCHITREQISNVSSLNELVNHRQASEVMDFGLSFKRKNGTLVFHRYNKALVSN